MTILVALYLCVYPFCPRIDYARWAPSPNPTRSLPEEHNCFVGPGPRVPKNLPCDNIAFRLDNITIRQKTRDMRSLYGCQILA